MSGIRMKEKRDCYLILNERGEMDIIDGQGRCIPFVIVDITEFNGRSFLVIIIGGIQKYALVGMKQDFSQGEFFDQVKDDEWVGAMETWWRKQEMKAMEKEKMN